MGNRRVIVIGAGPGGLCMAIKLQAAGYDFVVLEKAPGVGGTWQHNRYPGAACDVQSALYSYSFAPKQDWSRPYATQPEILEYFNGIADRYELRPYIRFNTEVRAAKWDDAAGQWQVTTVDDEVLTADVVVSGIGMFNELNLPRFDGMASFGGEMFHTARWPADHSLAGQRVAVIGSAASAVQAIPEIAKEASQLTVFQRSANWVMPKDDTPYTDEQLHRLRTDPVAAREQRFEIYKRVESFITFSNPGALKAAEVNGIANISVVNDPELRRKLTPSVPYGCHRPLISNDYYPTFNLPHVELVTDRIERFTSHGIVTVDGVERSFDTVVLATGFHPTKYLSAVSVTGRGGVSIDAAWNDGAQAYLGITTAGFPNLFMLYGPNTNNGSIIFMLECQVGYIMRQLEHLESEGLRWIDVKPDVMSAYNDSLQVDIGKVDVWQADCHGYYRAESGRIVTQWPHTMSEFRDRTAQPDPHAYEVAYA